MFVVAVDGPAGSGKSSVCREAARRLNFDYLDTGAGYRAFTLHAMNHPEASAEKLLASWRYEASLDPSDQWQKLAGIDVTDAIRESTVASQVSVWAAKPEVRAAQRADARARIASSKRAGIIVEGRDITTVVAADAELRVLLTATESVRLQRRGMQGGEEASNLISRDLSDSRVVDFMTPADGVDLLDTTNLDFEQSVQALLDLIAERRID